MQKRVLHGTTSHLVTEWKRAWQCANSQTRLLSVARSWLQHMQLFMQLRAIRPSPNRNRDTWTASEQKTKLYQVLGLELQVKLWLKSEIRVIVDRDNAGRRWNAAGRTVRPSLVQNQQMSTVNWYVGMSDWCWQACVTLDEFRRMDNLTPIVGYGKKIMWLAENLATSEWYSYQVLLFHLYEIYSAMKVCETTLWRPKSVVHCTRTCAFQHDLPSGFLPLASPKVSSAHAPSHEIMHTWSLRQKSHLHSHRRLSLQVSGIEFYWIWCHCLLM